MTKNDNLTNLTSQTNLTNLTTQTNQTNLTKHPKQIKHTHKVYSAWNYEKEIEDLNKASEEGGQLVKGGSFGSKFERNPNMQYRYQLDFRRVENMGRYIETYVSRVGSTSTPLLTDGIIFVSFMIRRCRRRHTRFLRTGSPFTR